MNYYSAVIGNVLFLLLLKGRKIFKKTTFINMKGMKNDCFSEIIVFKWTLLHH